jgi:hypothetical protein
VEPKQEEGHHAGSSDQLSTKDTHTTPEIDDFGLPVRVSEAARPNPADSDSGSDSEDAVSFHDAAGEKAVDQGYDGTQSGSTLQGTQIATGSQSTFQEGPPTADRPSTPPQPIKSGPDSRSSSPRGSSEFSTPRKQNKPPQDAPAVSEFSHQRLVLHQAESEKQDDQEDEWKTMPAVAEYDLYNDDGKLVAKAADSEDEGPEISNTGLGSAGMGYTRIQLDEDAKSTTSLDEDTSYLFRDGQKDAVLDEDDQRDAVSQLQATKDLLTEGQRIAYVGVSRLVIYNMLNGLEGMTATRGTKKSVSKAIESLNKWGQLVMSRLYAHMDIDPAEQIMIEQLADHGVQPKDLVPPLMKNSRLANPIADDQVCSKDHQSTRDPSKQESALSPSKADPAGEVPELDQVDDVPKVSIQMEHTTTLDLDLRWTVLCDLFLLLISDSVYDARSRRLLEQVAEAMDISSTQICRFEKRVIDALEMQEAADKENWNEQDHMETRRKMGLKKKYMVMGVATVGGGLVIGLSAGLLAPVIGAGLAAGFTTIGVTGTAGFLGGVGGAALITSAATAAGGTIAVRASHRRTGAVKTFEYRPLHNKKRLNLILTVSGWMNGKVDDVRLPYSTVDPVMGDIYSLLWEPEMLQSMGDTINILATEALTQTVQQVLGSTILVALMASLQLPIVLTKLSYLIDNPWTVSLDRANAAGLILADSLIDRHLGNRPITLLGFSLGSRLIFSCLRELAARSALGIVQNVFLFGSPIVAKRDEYVHARSVVSGRFVNGFASNDWILGYLFRATSGGIMRVAGLAPVEDVPGVENLDVTQLVNGHMAYRTAMPKLLREVGWEVESDEFTEIEDPDPDNHQNRQRELIKEIDEARKDAEAKPGKKRFGFFRRGRLAEKKGWETYQMDSKSDETRPPTASNGGPGSGNVLFDIDAIRRELESEMIEVRQLESTLPPMQLNLNDSGDQRSPYSSLRQTKSSDAAVSTETRNGRAALPSLSSLSQQSEVDCLKLPPRPSEIDDENSQRINGNDNTNLYTTTTERTTNDDRSEQSHVLQKSFPVIHNYPEEESPLDSPERPVLHTRATMPLSMGGNTSASDLEHNAWADDDKFFGRER